MSTNPISSSASLQAAALPATASAQTAPDIIICGKCFKEGTESTPLLLCGRCQEITYCNRDCQKTHWKVHKLVCKALEKTPPVENPQASAVASSPIPIEYAELNLDIEKWELVYSHKPAINTSSSGPQYRWQDHYLLKNENFQNPSESLTVHFVPLADANQKKFNTKIEEFQNTILNGHPNAYSETIERTFNEWVWLWDIKEDKKNPRNFGVIRILKTANGLHILSYNNKKTLISEETRALWIKYLREIKIKKN